MKAIVRVDQNWGIGNKGDLISILPEDMKYFRRMTLGKTVIMGRKTLESFPEGKPLKNRKNLILSRDPSFTVEGAQVFSNVDQILQYLGADADDAFVIGGATVYQEMLELCDTVYVTKMEIEFPADTWFPNLDQKDEWEITEKSDAEKFEHYLYYYLTYQKKK